MFHIQRRKDNTFHRITKKIFLFFLSARHGRRIKYDTRIIRYSWILRTLSFVALFQRISILGCFFSSRVSESNFHRLKEGDSRLLPSGRSLFLRLRRHAPAVSPLKARSFEFLIHWDYITIMAIRVPLLSPC